MRNYQKLLFFSLWNLCLISCGGSASEDDTLPKPTPDKEVELSTPNITAPQADAVCQGRKQSNGKFNIVVKSTEHYNVDYYLFQLWDNVGKLVEEIQAKTNYAEFTNIEKGSAYTVAVRISNSSSTKNSNKISFCTPGVQVSNYIPTVKTASYSKQKAMLSIIFHDPDTTDTSLFYGISKSKDKDFKKTIVLKSNVKTPKDSPTVLSNINLEIGTYVKIVVRDAMGSQSAYVFRVTE